MKKIWLVGVLFLVGCRQQDVAKREQKKASKTVERIQKQYESLFLLAQQLEEYKDRMHQRMVQDDFKELIGIRNYEYRQRGFLHRLDPMVAYPFVQVEREVSDRISWLKKVMKKALDSTAQKNMQLMLDNLYTLHRTICLHPVYRKELRQYQDYTLIGGATNATGIEIDELKRCVLEDEKVVSR